jgi:hypothetical protein
MKYGGDRKRILRRLNRSCALRGGYAHSYMIEIDQMTVAVVLFEMNP